MDNPQTRICICPVCQYQTSSSANFCIYCGCRLSGNLGELQTLHLAPINAGEMNDAERNAPGLASTQKVLQLFLDGHSVSKVVAIPVNKTILLGRSQARETMIYDELVALDEFGAHEKGVSRVHAVLRRMPHVLQIIDLDSRNGTFINRKRLKPLQPYVLADRDEIQLAYFTVKLSLESAGMGL